MLPRTIFAIIFVFFLSASSSAEPQLAVRLDRSAIYEGETFHYRLVVSDAAPLADDVMPDTSAWTDFHVQPLARQPMQQGGSFFSLTINGVTNSSRTTAVYSTQFDYILTPRRTGILSIPLPQVTVNGKVLPPQSISVNEGERQILADFSVSVRVLEPDEQDIVFLSIETNRNRLYPLQHLEVTLVVQIKGLPDRLAGTDPLTRLRQPPKLHIPWAAENPKGFKTSQTLESWLNSFVVRPAQGGLSINDYANSRDIFSLAFSGDPFQRTLLHFSNTPQQVTRPDGQDNTATYWEYRFPRTFTPHEFGTYSFGPVTLKGTLPIADPTVPNEISGQQIYAVAKPVTVLVVDVPLDNRPADYIGAFGSFRWETSLAPQRARVGDPMTLTLCLSGQGSTANVRPLDLSANPDVAAHFRVHSPTEDVQEQSCTFTYTIRPLNAGSITFPPISVSVFDVNTEQFVPLQSLPIPLEIAEAETVQSATLFGSVPGDVQLSEGGLFANKTTLSETFPPITFVQWAVIVSALAGSYAVIALGVFLLRCQWTTPQRQRRRGALHRAQSRLAVVASTLRGRKAVNIVEISGELQGVFFGYIADRLNGIEQGMTTSDACRQLLENRVPEPLTEAVRSALESLDAVKYGGVDIRSLDELTRTASVLLRQLESVSDVSTPLHKAAALTQS